MFKEKLHSVGQILSDIKIVIYRLHKNSFVYAEKKSHIAVIIYKKNITY